MRTAHIIPVFPKLSETFILTQLTGLIERGVEVDVFALAVGAGNQVHKDVEAYGLMAKMQHLKVPRNRLKRLGKLGAELAQPRAWHRATLSALNPLKHGKEALKLGKAYTALSFLKAKQEKEPYDIIHCHFGYVGLTGLELLEQGLTKAKLVTSLRGADMTSTLKAHPDIYKTLVKRGDHFLPVSKFFKEKLINKGCAPEKITVLHDGVDIEHFSFKVRGRGPGEATRLLFIGRLADKKGIFVAVEAVAKSLEEGHALGFDIVGDGPLRPQLETFIAQRGIGEHVTLHGAQPRDKVADYLQASHLLIAPSITSARGDQEGIPTTVKEGMAVGMPVLSTLHSGIPELVEDGVSGFLVPENNADALSERLNYLIEHPDLWPEMGRAGRKKIEAEFDNEKLNDALVSIYERLLS